MMSWLTLDFLLSHPTPPHPTCSCSLQIFFQERYDDVLAANPALFAHGAPDRRTALSAASVRPLPLPSCLTCPMAVINSAAYAQLHSRRLAFCCELAACAPLYCRCAVRDAD